MAPSVEGILQEGRSNESSYRYQESPKEPVNKVTCHVRGEHGRFRYLTIQHDIKVIVKLSLLHSSPTVHSLKLAISSVDPLVRVLPGVNGKQVRDCR
jgi:hypothetical protein